MQTMASDPPPATVLEHRLGTYERLWDPPQPDWTIGIIATDPEELAAAMVGLEGVGFGPSHSRLLVVRNFGTNYDDGYSGIRRFLGDAAGRFLMVMHQDVTPIDGAGVLMAQLDLLDQREPSWALAGNSGFIGLGRLARRISDPYGRDQRAGELPAKVWSVDENVLILNLRDPVHPSAQLSGFHFYGTDLALQGRLRGRGTYVIDWHVDHASKGTLSQSWEKGLTAIEREYDGRLGSIVFQVPTTLLIFGAFRPLRAVRKTVWRVVRHGSRWLARAGLRR